MRSHSARLALLGLVLPCSVACPTTFEGLPPSLSTLTDPVALAVTPDQRHVLVAGGNFDLKFRGGTLIPISVEDREIVRGAGVEIGPFAGRVVLHPNGRRAYVSVRGNDSMTWVEIDPDAPEGIALDCGGGTGGRCDDAHEVTLADKAHDTDRVLREPFGLEIVCTRDGLKCTDARGLVVSYMRDGDVALFPLDDEGDPRDTGVTGHRLARAQDPEAPISIDGVNGLAVSPDGRFGFATSMIDDVLRRFEINLDADPSLQLERATTLVGSLHDGRLTLARAIAIGPGGDRFFIAARQPGFESTVPSHLMVVDSTIGNTGRPGFRVVKLIPLEDRAGQVRILPGGPGRGDLVYVTLFRQGRVVVIDALRLAVIDVINTRRGPYDLAFVRDGDRQEAWVTEFGNASIAVIDVNPDHVDTYHTVVARLD